MGEIEFTVRCRMHKQWVSPFLGMLRRMEYLGSIGQSRCVVFYADGDGDFRPNFSWVAGLADIPPAGVDARGFILGEGDKFFDRGDTT